MQTGYRIDLETSLDKRLAHHGGSASARPQIIGTRHDLNNSRVFVSAVSSNPVVEKLMLDSGGLEMLFSNQRVHKLEIPARITAKATPNIAWLIDYLCANKLKDPRKDLFVLDDTVYATFQH
jgi:hypothetical protein